MTFINTVDGYAWLVLYMESLVSALAWKMPTAATITKQYRRNAERAVQLTDPENIGFVDYMCHDFSSRGLTGEWDMISVGLGHASSFRGSDTMITIPASQYYYPTSEGENYCPINSVLASEHSVTCTQLFYYIDRLKNGLYNDVIKHYYSFDLPCDGSIEDPDYFAIAEYMNLNDWLDRFPTGILSYVCDTFDTWKTITHVVTRLKDKILSRDGKLVLRPDSGNPVDIICGLTDKEWDFVDNNFKAKSNKKGVVELLYDIFGGEPTSTGYIRLNSHIGCIYGDSITLEKQEQIYDRLAAKKFAATNVVLGIGSFTYEYLTRDTFGWAAKASWFEIEQWCEKPCGIQCESEGKCGQPTRKSFNIYKDPITDDGTKKSLKGFVKVHYDGSMETYQKLGKPSDGTMKPIVVKTECTEEQESRGLLEVIFENGKMLKQYSFEQIRENLKKI